MLPVIRKGFSQAVNSYDYIVFWFNPLFHCCNSLIIIFQLKIAGYTVEMTFDRCKHKIGKRPFFYYCFTGSIYFESLSYNIFSLIIIF